MKRLLLIALSSVACVTTAQEGEKMRNDLAALRGQLEVIQHRLDAMDKGTTDQQKTMDALNQFVAQQKKEQERPTDRGALYNLGRQKLDQGQPAKARDALLKIGMSFQAQGDCQNALLFFDEVAQAHKGAPAAKTAHDRAVECRKRGGKGKAQSRSR